MKLNNKWLFLAAFFVLALPLIFINGNAQASVYNYDGAVHDATTHTWVAPSDNGYCMGAVSTDPVGTAAHNLGGVQTEPGSRCADLAPSWLALMNADNDTYCNTTYGKTCQTACTDLGFNWHTYSTPADCENKWVDDTDTAAAAGRTAHECLYCHDGGHASNRTGYLKGGHKNMSRAADGIPWTTSIEFGSTDLTGYDWTTAGTVGGVSSPSTLADGTTPVFWIYDGWLSASPRAVTSGGSYVCGRCHTTGWTADATINTSKEPEKSFPGINSIVDLSAADDSGVKQPYSSWDHFGILCSRCHNAVDGGHANSGPAADNMVFPGTSRGVTTTIAQAAASQNAKCYNCHRQVDGNNLPLDAATRKIGEELNIASSHGSLGIKSHANGFLNSPHARFSGTYGQLADSTLYDSHFTTKYGSCAACHNVHDSLTDTAADAKPWNNECGLDCHTQSPSDPYAKPLTAIHHPSGVGTPLENATALDPVSACQTCHMPGGIHLFRISTDPNYTTFPGANQNVPTVANSNGFPEAYVDLDLACGQCHGGSAGASATKNNAPYFDKYTLSTLAAGMHSTSGTGTGTSTAAGARFNWTKGADCNAINLDGSINGAGTSCSWTITGGSFTSGSASTCIATYKFDNSGSYPVTLTVNGSATRTMVVSATTVNSVPATAMTVVPDGTDPSGMSITLTDGSGATSCAATSSGTGIILWGDGTTDIVATTIGSGQATNHTYKVKGTYTVRYAFRDSANNKAMANPVTITVPSTTVGLYTVSGVVTYADGQCVDSNHNGSCADPGDIDLTGTVVPNVTIFIKTTGGTIVKVGKSLSDGTFTITGVQGGQDYVIVPVKTGVNFAPATTTITNLSADSTGNTFVGTLAY